MNLTSHHLPDANDFTGTCRACGAATHDLLQIDLGEVSIGNVPLCSACAQILTPV